MHSGSLSGSKLEGKKNKKNRIQIRKINNFQYKTPACPECRSPVQTIINPADEGLGSVYQSSR